MSHTIWYTRCPVATASGLAFQLGMFEQEFAGSEFEVRNIKELGKEKADTHFDHSLASSVREGGSIPPMWARTRGADTTMVGLTFVADSLCTYVRADSDIERVSDLKGRRCALPVRPYILIDFMKVNAHKGFHATLESAGLSEDDVEFVEIEINDDMHAHINPNFKAAQGERTESLYDPDLQALLDGRVDAIFCKNAETRFIERLYGDRIRCISDLVQAPNPAHRVNANPRIITVSSDLCRERPEAVIRYLQVLIRAARWASENAPAATRTLAVELGVSEADIRGSYEHDFHTRLWPSLDDEIRGLLQVQIDFMQGHGYLGAIDIDGWMDGSFLDEAYRREKLDGAA